MRQLIIRLLILGALGVVDYRIHRPWRLVVLAVLLVYVVEWAGLRHRRVTIEIVRRRRHRLANQLQVVDGWLQLGSLSKAQQHLAEMMRGEAEQTLWFHKMPSYWGHALLAMDAAGEARGIRLRFQGLETVLPTYYLTWMVRGRLAKAMRMAEERIEVVFATEAFRIEVPLVQQDPQTVKRPRGWYVTVDGVAVDWPKRSGSIGSSSRPTGPMDT